jgi:hypothetical protein
MRMISRLLVPGTALALAVGAAVAVVPAQAAASPRGAACVLAGSASISPGLTTAAQTEHITLSGVSLTNCKAGSAGAPGVPPALSGSVTANPITAVASCAKGNLTITATINWSTGQSTSATVNTTGLAASQTLKGNVTSSTNPSIKPGDLVAGQVAFRPTTAAQNCAKVPVTAVTFNGALGAGSPK